MNISRSGYYKWLKNKDILNNYEINRRDLNKKKLCEENNIPVKPLKAKNESYKPFKLRIREF